MSPAAPVQKVQKLQEPYPCVLPGLINGCTGQGHLFKAWGGVKVGLWARRKLFVSNIRFCIVKR